MHLALPLRHFDVCRHYRCPEKQILIEKDDIGAGLHGQRQRLCSGRVTCYLEIEQGWTFAS